MDEGSTLLEEGSTGAGAGAADDDGSTTALLEGAGAGWTKVEEGAGACDALGLATADDEAAADALGLAAAAPDWPAAPDPFAAWEAPAFPFAAWDA